MFIFPVQLTTSRIGNLTRLIHTLLYVMTIDTYIHTCLTPELRRILEGSVLFKIVLRKDGMAVYCGDKVDLLLQPNALIDATFSHLHMNPCIAGVGCLCRGVFPSHSRRSQPRQKKFG